VTPAEFKTVRESLNLSAKDVADRLGLKSDRTIRFWESGGRGIPDDAAELLIDMDTVVEHAILHAVEAVEETIAEIGQPPAKPVTISRYVSDEQFARLDPESFSLRHT